MAVDYRTFQDGNIVLPKPNGDIDEDLDLSTPNADTSKNGVFSIEVNPTSGNPTLEVILNHPSLLTETFGNNVTSTYNVLRAAADLGVKKVVIASSTAAFGFIYAKNLWPPDYLPVDETHPSKPQDSYGLSKVIGEQIAYSIVIVHKDMTISSLRFPGVNFDLSYESFRDRWRNPATRASGFWTYIDARDAAMTCRMALEAKFHGHEVFIAAAPNNCMIQTTLELIKKYLPKGAKIKTVSGTHWSCVDSAKARRMLGFKPNHVWQDYLQEGQPLASPDSAR